MTDNQKDQLKQLLDYTAPELLREKLEIFIDGVIARERYRAADIIEGASDAILDEPKDDEGDPDLYPT